MATGLQTFDNFTWASLLKGREMLVIDRERGRGRANAEALEEAGAVVTLAPGQTVGVDRLKDGGFRHIVLALSCNEAIGEAIASHLTAAGGSGVILADATRRAALRSVFPEARIGDHTLDARELVLFIIGTSDE